jgi:hypothetical protein
MALPDSVHALHRDLQTIFGPRLISLAIYHPATPPPGAPVHTFVTVERLDTVDLRACAERIAIWHGHGLATPLVLPGHEFGRALDAFPLEFGAILAAYDVVSGADPFAGLSVNDDDVRRACEVQTRSHLLHLREGFIEAQGRGQALADLIADSAAPLAGLLIAVARLLKSPATTPSAAADAVERAAHLAPGSLSDVIRHAGDGQPAKHLFEPYLAAIEQLAQFIDRWSRQ